ncbi:MAG: RraA family protein, partial [Pseudolysinimonas sp.]
MGVFERVAGDERLTSAMVSDALDECGLRSQVLESRLAPVVQGSRAFGRAATAHFVPSESDQPDDPYGAAIDF